MWFPLRRRTWRRINNKMTIDILKPSYELNILDPAALHFWRTENGTLRLTLRDQASFLRVEIIETYPVTNPRNFISIRDGLDKNVREIGVIEDLETLSPGDKVVVKDELARRYMVPVIEKIVNMNDVYGALEWEVESSHGDRKFTMRDIHDSIRPVGEDDYLLIDTDECRYRIPDLKKLDKRSRDLFGKYFYQ